MTDSKELIVPIDLSPEKAFAMFIEDKEFDELFASIKAQTDAHEPDLETAKGRDEIKSLAYKVTRTKTFLDSLGKGVKEEAQKTVDAVDAHRRRMKAKLDDLAATVRKPVTEFEEKEKARLEKLSAALNQVNDLKRIPFDATASGIEEMIERLETVSRETDWQEKAEQAKQSIDDTGQILHTALDAAKTREENARLAAQAEAERQEREAREAKEREEREAAEKARMAKEREEMAARIEADRAQKAELERLKRETLEAEQRATRAEQQAAEAKEQAEREAQEAEARVKREAERAEQLKAEQERQAKEKAEAEAQALKEQEDRERLAKANRQQRISEAVEDLQAMAGQASPKQIVDAIIDGKIRHVTFG